MKTLLISLYLILVLGTAKAQLTLQVVNHNPAYSDTNVYFRFGGSSAITGTINGQPIKLGTNYTIAEIGQRCADHQFYSRRKNFHRVRRAICVGNARQSFNPNFANSSLPDYYTRWDKVELSYITTDAGSVANLTADDFAGFPMKLTAGNTSLGWHYRGSMNELLSSLAALTTNDTRAVITNSSQIIRIISPHTAFLCQLAVHAALR
ncbi:MAG: beta-1,3-glucanase family protein [Limisphaerales bacterium]